MISMSLFVLAGPRSVWRRRITRPSRFVTVPSSSAHCLMGKMTCACSAVSLMKESHTTSNSSCASRSRTLEAFGEATTTFEPNTRMPRKPPGLPMASSIS